MDAINTAAIRRYGEQIISVLGLSASPVGVRFLADGEGQVNEDTAQQAFGLTSKQQTRMDTDDKETRS